MQTFRIIAKNSSHENAASKLVLAAVRFFILARRLRLLPLLKFACSRSFSAFAVPATIPHGGATSGFLLLDGYALGWAAKAAQTADTGATGWDWRFGCAFNLCSQ